jgi:hypothetical protein
MQLELRIKCQEKGQWERRRPAGNALRINIAANLHSCRRDAGAPSTSQFKTDNQQEPLYRKRNRDPNARNRHLRELGGNFLI